MYSNCDEDAISYKEETPLYKAAFRGKKENVQLLISQDEIDANILAREYNNIFDYNESALQMTVFYGRLSILEILLENKDIDVNSKFVGFRYLIKGKDIWCDESIKLLKLQEHMSLLFSYEKNALYTAIKYESISIITHLIKHKNIDINSRSYQKSLRYSSKNDVYEKKLMIMTPLYTAIHKNNEQIVQLLIGHDKIDINAKSTFYLCKYNEVLTDEMKQKIGEQIVDKEETALHYAVSKGNLNIIKLLLNHKNINTDVLDKQGKKAIELTSNNEIISLFNK